ncbi:nucleoside permease [Pontiella sp.]|uniref:nucleoside permease n=1 Tax=Pontiella sp. TaxID=2837462 RepID=UPI0035685661
MSEKKSPVFIVPRLSVMMFLQFFVWGAWFVTVGNYMFKQGMGDSVGWAYSIGPIAAIISPFVLGMVADRFFATERVLGALHIVGGVLMFCAPMVVDGAESAGIFLTMLFLHMLCYMPTLGLTNTLAFHNITNQEKEFPLIRVFGTIGWIVAGVFVSKVLHSDQTALPFRIAGISGVVLGVYSLTLPNTPPPAKGKKVSLRDVLCLDAIALLKKPSFLVFIVSSMLICVPLAAYYAYAPVFVNDAGLADPAFKMTFGQMSEIFFMLVMPLFFARLGVKKMLLVGMLAWVVRYGLFALGAPAGTMWMILVGIALHGICYDFFFVTGQIYVDKAAPKPVRGQAQGLLILVTQGVGMLVGAQIAGRLHAAFVMGHETDVLLAWQNYWYIPCAAAAVIMVFFAIFFKASVEKPVEPA